MTIRDLISFKMSTVYSTCIKVTGGIRFFLGFVVVVVGFPVWLAVFRSRAVQVCCFEFECGSSIGLPASSCRYRCVSNGV